MLETCIQEAINQTEYMNRGLTQKTAEDISDRIFQLTGYQFAPERLYQLYRERCSEIDANTQEKNAIAQFAQYHSWEHFIALKKNQHPKQAFEYTTFAIILLFIVLIYVVFRITAAYILNQ